MTSEAKRGQMETTRETLIAEAIETLDEADAELLNLTEIAQLQSQMQNANRQYTKVSNIMKTKHDTVKNSISNIR
jgi:hypothetical protein